MSTGGLMRGRLSRCRRAIVKVCRFQAIQTDGIGATVDVDFVVLGVTLQDGKRPRIRWLKRRADAILPNEDM